MTFQNKPNLKANIGSNKLYSDGTYINTSKHDNRINVFAIIKNIINKFIK